MKFVPNGNTTCPSERNSKTSSFQAPAREVPCMSKAILLRLAPGQGVLKRCPPDGMLHARVVSEGLPSRSPGGSIVNFHSRRSVSTCWALAAFFFVVGSGTRAADLDSANVKKLRVLVAHDDLK